MNGWMRMTFKVDKNHKKNQNEKSSVYVEATGILCLSNVKTSRFFTLPFNHN